MGHADGQGGGGAVLAEGRGCWADERAGPSAGSRQTCLGSSDAPSPHRTGTGRPPSTLSSVSLKRCFVSPAIDKALRCGREYFVRQHSEKWRFPGDGLQALGSGWWWGTMGPWWGAVGPWWGAVGPWWGTAGWAPGARGWWGLGPPHGAPGWLHSTDARCCRQEPGGSYGQ